jgi:hypothetical protein
MNASLPRPDQAQTRRQGKRPLDDCVTSLRTERNPDQGRGIAGPCVFVSAAQAGMRERHFCSFQPRLAFRANWRYSTLA